MRHLCLRSEWRPDYLPLPLVSSSFSWSSFPPSPLSLSLLYSTFFSLTFLSLILLSCTMHMACFKRARLFHALLVF